MNFAIPNKTWPFKKLMKLGKVQLWKMAVSYDESIKHMGIDYFTMPVLADIINFELLKTERN